MKNLIEQLINSNDAREVDRIVEKNIFEICPNQRTKLSQYANNAKKRIALINVEKKDSYKLQIN